MPSLRDVLDELLGAGETALTLGTGAASGVAGMPYGLYKGLTSGKYLEGKAADIASKEAAKFMERNTYIPRGDSGRSNLSALAKIMDASKLPPVIPEAVMLSSIPRAAAAAQAERFGMSAEKALEAPVNRIMAKGGRPAQLLSDLAKGTTSPVTVYHGSPHRFDKFDASKIGTGEGAQAYGLGIYTAENPAVARGYRDKLQKVDYSGSQIDPANPSHVALATMEKFGDTEKASAYLKQRANLMDYDINMQAAKLLDDKAALPTRNAYGFLYKVDLPDAMIPKMLDYDKPLSKQDPYVRDIIAKAFPSGYIKGKFVDPLNSPVTGRAMLDQLNMIANQRNEPGLRSAETALRQAGIPGIKYLDEGSRAKGEGTRNFVTFPGEEKNLRIETINGDPLDLLLQGVK
jgi:hypothetical protein